MRRHELEAERSELSAMLVHDLKTPLTVILSGIALLQDQMAERASGRDNTDASKRTFDLLNSSADRLQRMIEDVLQLSRLEEMPDLPKQPVDVAATARALAKDFSLIARSRQQNLMLEVPETLKLPVSGDALLLRRVLDNLVHNAVEHTPSGGSIVIEAWQEEGLARLSVSDSGPGIPEEARERIFQKFFQKDMKQHVGNVGLGLALCQKVVQRHGGSISVEDAQPKGACFSITLPLAKSA
jgi:signal transduction histidine kinase